MRVLVVDDSAVVRRIFRELLEAAGGFEVDTAADPFIAMSKMAVARPDVMVLDLELPRMDGLTFLRKVMKENPLPVVVVSGLAARGTEVAVQALAEGAVEVIAKPSLGAAEFLTAAVPRFVELLRQLGPAKRPEVKESSRPVQPRREASELVAVGASTGGPEALFGLVRGLRPSCPPVVVVQHMPREFTGPFAARLDRECEVRVCEAEEGLELSCGQVVIARGDRHLKVRRHGGRLLAALDGSEPRRFHRPSADVLFESVRSAVGNRAVGVLLTGMGSDGAEGLLAMRAAGAWTLAQDEASCVVFGMPKAAIHRGAVDEVLSLADLIRVLAQVRGSS